MEEDHQPWHMLEEAIPGAVRLLVDVMEDEQADRKLRVEIAKELLSRVYGRGPVAPPEDEDSGNVTFLLAGDLARYAR
jgi:hypothetical protein